MENQERSIHLNNIRFLRRRRGMSVSELARRAGIARNTVYSIEDGGNSTVAVLERIAAALECGYDDLFVCQREAVAS